MPKPTHKACQVVELRARSGRATLATRFARMVAVENETGRQLHARVSFDAETGALVIVIGEGAADGRSLWSGCEGSASPEV